MNSSLVPASLCSQSTLEAHQVDLLSTEWGEPKLSYVTLLHAKDFLRSFLDPSSTLVTGAGAAACG